MKRLTLLASGLLLLTALIFTACTGDTPADTTAPDGPDAATDAPTEASTDTPTEDVTDNGTIDTPTDTPTDVSTDTSTDTPTEPLTRPTADPTDAAAAGLPLDGDSYTVGGENPAASPKTQYDYLTTYAPAYADKSFTVYGHVAENEYGRTVISVGEDMHFGVYFDGVAEPIVGSYVKITATFTQTVDKGDYTDFDCFTMMVTAVDVLEEAQGPTGGKYMYVTTGLNVRSEPDSTKENKVGLLEKGDMVEVLETGLGANQTWCKIVFDCDAGYAYVSMNYLTETEP